MSINKGRKTKSAAIRNIVVFLSLWAFVIVQQAIGQTPMSQKMANSIMNAYPTKYTEGTKTWSYVMGTVMKGFQEVYLKTNNAVYLTYIQNTVNNEVNTDGSMKSYKVADYNLDQVKEGSAVLFLYQKTSTLKYKTSADLIRTQLNAGQHPRTSEGGFWHKQVYPYQMWQDGLYMAEPFYAEYAKIFQNSDTAMLNDIVKQFILMETHARDKATGLIYHGWDEKKVQTWADPVTGCSKSFWGRAMGWYAMALVDALDYLPSNYAKCSDMISILQRLLTAVIAYQDSASGCWYQVVDQGARSGNYLESSASCMFVYAILKSVRLGYVNQSFLAAGRKGYNGILSTFITESGGNLTISKVCQSAGLNDSRNGTFEYYISEPVIPNDGKAQGPFMLASLEYEDLQTRIARTREPHAPRHEFVVRKAGAMLIVQCTLPENAAIQTVLFGLSGSVFAIPNKHVYQSGVHSIFMDLSGLPKGVYLISNKSGHRSASIKVILS